MTNGHWFWWALSWACVVWYSAVTLYVAIRGWSDVRQMLRRLRRREDDSPPPR